jgi:hypothetical protein
MALDWPHPGESEILKSLGWHLQTTMTWNHQKMKDMSELQILSEQQFFWPLILIHVSPFTAIVKIHLSKWDFIFLILTSPVTLNVSTADNSFSYSALKEAVKESKKGCHNNGQGVNDNATAIAKTFLIEKPEIELWRERRITNHEEFAEKLEIPVGSEIHVMWKGVPYNAKVCKIRQNDNGKTEFQVHYEGRKISQKWISINDITPIVSRPKTFYWTSWWGLRHGNQSKVIFWNIVY